MTKFSKHSRGNVTTVVVAAGLLTLSASQVLGAGGVASPPDPVISDARAQQCDVVQPRLTYRLADGREVQMTTTNDGPCRFALFWLPFSGAPNEARRPYSYMTVRQDPEMGSLAAVSDSNQTWIQYTPNAGAVGEDKFSFRLMPGSGIYDVTVKVSAARQPTPSPEPNPASLFVYFDLDKADLSPNTLLALDGVGRQMQDLQFRDFVLQIAGHADARGSDEYNVALSERRAEAVRAYLMRRYAISPSRVRAAAFGDKILIDKANPFADDNRRVHLTLVRGLRASAAVNP